MSDSLDGQATGNDGAIRTAARDNRVPPRTIVFIVASIALALACIVLTLQFFVVDRMPVLTVATLEAAEKLWQEKAPPAYDMDVEIQGAQPGSVHIEVRNNEVIAMTRDGRTPPPRTWDVWSVPGLFDMLERELVMAEDPEREMDVAAGTQLRLRAEFDSNLGFPWRFHRHVSGGGAEVYWRVTDFETR